MNLPNDRVTIIGIDCATKPSDVGVAIGRTCGMKLCFESGEMFRANDKRLAKCKQDPCIWTPLAKYLAEKIKDVDSVLFALDAPLGWPYQMRRELCCHTAGERPSVKPDSMFRRKTDCRVEEYLVKNKINKNPFEVGASWLARTAHAALSLLQEIREIRKWSNPEQTIPLAWKQGPPREPSVIEVYPALALLDLDPDRQVPSKFGEGYKSSKDPTTRYEARCAIWKQLASCVSGLRPDKPPGTDHAIDAVLCVKIAHDFIRDLCVKPPSSKVGECVVHKEGWIWFSDGTRTEK